MRAEVVRHGATMQSLLAELAGSSVRSAGLRAGPTAERRMSKKRAAGELGMSEARLMRLVVRYHAAHPDRSKLAVQPAGLKSSPWTVFVDRLRAVIESGEPY
ncbi:hypothetical protein [Methylobacterium radiotolerans]|uniref:Uncharacterized protein n=1 Tax=Methylobacterium radiotolerans (strain ATCC 27329 / DSM 1819 / JCM 2831 / NBRC 15690 / NCIMB 10815 / 0-1) TaxID=426355 RepID=B1MAB5_METRJ|nr:hypothetical protein [Methylobacterium radiotolerans]ACB28440.1 hypothetical protein Mrad2831_6528 [Methylobacterium radiotolerans JCM 2831]